ncbi:OmpA/MotB domain-containing protein [Flammeovirgaceae bacterium 311]|nr:OmpA/MotB domain-containing protein [Flammeovirgaceae bacterium 311]
MKKSAIKNILGLGLLWLTAGTAFAQSAAPKAVVVPPQTHVFEIPKKLPEGINSDVEETMPVLSQDGKMLFFVRVLHPENTGGRLSGHDIWYANRNEDGSWQSPKNSILSLNNKGNNAVLGFSEEGNRVYLLNQYGNGPSFKSGVSYADLSDNRWGFPKELKMPKMKKEGFFYNAYLSPDEEVMIVSMKQRGHPGDEDLFIAVRQGNGRWSDLQNMGAKINTPGFEAFPYLSADKQTLYFSSNGHGGYGDADIFMSTRQDESWTNWGKPVNLGKPVNSKGFDAGFALYTDSTAFFVSNREGGMSDIYQTRIARPMEQKEQAVPIVFQELTESELDSLKPTDEDNSMADLTDNKKEAIVVEDVYPLTVSIYFAFDSYQLSPEAQIKLRELFQKYTNGNDIKVGLTGHTDAIGSESYNKRLSVSRAQSAEEFLRNAGLAQERVNTEGKGEDEPAATNDTPEGRRQNRRVTIMVVK